MRCQRHAKRETRSSTKRQTGQQWASRLTSDSRSVEGFTQLCVGFTQMGYPEGRKRLIVWIGPVPGARTGVQPVQGECGPRRVADREGMARHRAEVVHELAVLERMQDQLLDRLVEEWR